MSEPLVVGLIRDGQRRFYADRWSAAFLRREILWGPEDFQAWAVNLHEIEDFEDCAAGVIVDFDEKRLTWTGSDHACAAPRVGVVYQQLLQAAWPGYEIVTTLSIEDIARAAGESDGELIERPYEGDLQWRPQSIREAAGRFEDGEEDYPGDWEDEFEHDGMEGSPRAWIALIDDAGVVRHRQLSFLPKNVLRNRGDVIRQLLDLPPAEAPPEKEVSEAMWIDVPRKEIGVWGPVSLHREYVEMDGRWRDWQVRWADQGYADQCKVCGPIGVPMKEEEALAVFLPTVLSTSRFDLDSMVGALGGEARKVGLKLAGCLYLVVCLPMLIFGLITWRWPAVGMSLLVTLVIFIIAYLVIEWRVRRSWAPWLRDEDEQHFARGADPCGPQEESERRSRVESLLQAAGFPPLAEIEPHFPEHDEMELLG